jgi:hypothetical protein
MDKALVFGTKDCRFESCQGQLFHLRLRAFVPTAISEDVSFLDGGESAGNLGRRLLLDATGRDGKFIEPYHLDDS